MRKLAVAFCVMLVIVIKLPAILDWVDRLLEAAADAMASDLSPDADQFAGTGSVSSSRAAELVMKSHRKKIYAVLLQALAALIAGLFALVLEELTQSEVAPSEE